MFCKESRTAFTILTILLSLKVAAQTAPAPTFKLNAMTPEGCFSSSFPLLDQGSWTFQTSGYCQPICVGLGKPVMAVTSGSNCYCGDLLPPANSKVDNSNCNTPCNGYDQEMCGGNEYWTVYLTGLNKNQIDNADPSSAAASSAAGKTATPPAVVTVGGSTVVMTVPASTGTSAASQGGSGGPNKAGIAAGVVVGLVVAASLVGGVWFFLRQRRAKAAKEEYRRQAAVNDFIGAGKAGSTSSMADSRLDPVVMMRRQSDGSIADNQDYSRRILKVTNPDDRA